LRYAFLSGSIESITVAAVYQYPQGALHNACLERDRPWIVTHWG
jgi:hypothetical protein